MITLQTNDVKMARQLIRAVTESQGTPTSFLKFIVESLRSSFPNEYKYGILVAARTGQVQKLGYLVKLGATTNDLIRPLLVASKNGHFDCVKYLLGLKTVVFSEATIQQAAKHATAFQHVEVLILILGKLDKYAPGYMKFIDELDVYALKRGFNDVSAVIQEFGY